MRKVPGLILIVFLFCSMTATAVYSKPAQVVLKSGLEIKTRQKYPAAFRMPRSWPTTAPDSLEALLQIGFPDPALCCDVQTKSHKAGAYLGPEDGKVSIYKKPGNYTYLLGNGIKIWSSPGSLITLEYGKHKVWSYRLSDGRRGKWNRRAIWQFPDGTRLVRYYNPAFKRFFYSYHNEAAGRVYDFDVLNDILPESTGRSGYKYFYKKSYKHYIEMYLKSSQRIAFEKWSDSIWPNNKQRSIPLLIFETEAEYNDYLQEKKLAVAGGRGYAGVVVLCCGAGFGRDTGNSVKSAALSRQFNYAVQMHEMTHNRMQQACYIFNGYDVKKEKYPGHVFSEGMAELAVTKINTYYKDYLLKKAHKLTLRHRWNYEALSNTSGKYYYPLMFAYMNYLEDQYGLQRLQKYHKFSCLGQDNDVAAHAVWGFEHAQLFNKFIEVFK